MSVALSVRGIAKSYGELVALRGVSFDAAAGEVLAIVGPNGAGKTTLLATIAGTQRASAGTVRIGAGATQTPGGAERRARVIGRMRARVTGDERSRRPAVGWAPQQPALYSRLTVAENLELFARLERVADPHAAVERMLDQTGLRERARERVARLSGGNRQRVNVAIGLLADPPVLALDEPSAALDPAQRERLWEFIERLAHDGRSVIFSSHNMAEVERHAARVIVLHRGEELFAGAPAELLSAAGDAGDLEGALVAFIERHEHESARESAPARGQGGGQASAREGERSA